jgi:DNA-binding transcriptional LysR family regulator
MSQPALSHQISALEREIGAPMVERLARGIRPTPAGRAAAQEARSALHHAGPRPSETSHHTEMLGREEMVVVAAGGHPFADGPSVELTALTREPFIGYDPDNGLSVWLDTLAAEHRIQFDPVLRTRSPRTAAGLAAAGLGVTIVPVSALTGGHQGTVRPLHPPVLRDIVVTVAAPVDELSRRFVSALRERGLPDGGRAVFARS